MKMKLCLGVLGVIVVLAWGGPAMATLDSVGPISQSDWQFSFEENVVQNDVVLPFIYIQVQSVFLGTADACFIAPVLQNFQSVTYTKAGVAVAISDPHWTVGPAMGGTSSTPPSAAAAWTSVAATDEYFTMDFVDPCSIPQSFNFQAYNASGVCIDNTDAIWTGSESTPGTDYGFYYEDASQTQPEIIIDEAGFDIKSKPVVPEPLTMLTAFLAISGVGAYVRKHTRHPAVLS